MGLLSSRRHVLAWVSRPKNFKKISKFFLLRKCPSMSKVTSESAGYAWKAPQINICWKKVVHLVARGLETRSKKTGFDFLKILQNGMSSLSVPATESDIDPEQKWLAGQFPQLKSPDWSDKKRRRAQQQAETKRFTDTGLKPEIQNVEFIM